LPADELLNGGG